jgi:hypothetical protein
VRVAANDDAVIVELIDVSCVRMPCIVRVAVAVPSEFVPFSTPRMTSDSSRPGTSRKIFARCASYGRCRAGCLGADRVPVAAISTLK